MWKRLVVRQFYSLLSFSNLNSEPAFGAKTDQPKHPVTALWLRPSKRRACRHLPSGDGSCCPLAGLIWQITICRRGGALGSGSSSGLRASPFASAGDFQGQGGLWATFSSCCCVNDRGGLRPMAWPHAAPLGPRRTSAATFPTASFRVQPACRSGFGGGPRLVRRWGEVSLK